MIKEEKIEGSDQAKTITTMETVLRGIMAKVRSMSQDIQEELMAELEELEREVSAVNELLKPKAKKGGKKAATEKTEGEEEKPKKAKAAPKKKAAAAAAAEASIAEAAAVNDDVVVSVTVTEEKPKKAKAAPKKKAAAVAVAVAEPGATAGEALNTERP